MMRSLGVYLNRYADEGNTEFLILKEQRDKVVIVWKGI